MATDPIFIFIVQALAILVLPVAAWRLFCLRGVVPLVVVQILVGIALGPTLFGRFAPDERIIPASSSRTTRSPNSSATRGNKDSRSTPAV